MAINTNNPVNVISDNIKLLTTAKTTWAFKCGLLTKHEIKMAGYYPRTRLITCIWLKAHYFLGTLPFQVAITSQDLVYLAHSWSMLYNKHSFEGFHISLATLGFSVLKGSKYMYVQVHVQNIINCEETHFCLLTRKSD